MAGIETTIGASVPAGFASGLSSQAIWDMLVRNRIIPGVIDARNNEVPVLGRLYRNKKEFSGKFWVQSVRFGRNYAGIGFTHPEGNMPDPGRQGAYQYNLATRDCYARIKLTGALLRRARGAEAMVAPMQYESQGIVQDLSIKQEIQFHGDGSGRRAEVSAVSAAVVTTRFNQDIFGIGNCTSSPNIWCDVNMRFAFVTAGGTVRQTAGSQQAFYVVGLPATNQLQMSLTLGGAAMDPTTIVGLVAGDWIVDANRDANMSATSGVPLDTAWRQEPMGLEGIFRATGVLDGTGISSAGQQTGAFNYTVAAATDQAAGFQGIQVNGSALSAAYPPPLFNKALCFDSGGAGRRPVNDLLIQQALSTSKRQNNANVKFLQCAWEMYDSYFGTLVNDKRFNSTALRGGHEPEGGIPFNGLDFFRSRFMLGNRIQGIDDAQLSIIENEPLQPCHQPGGPPWQQLADKDAFWQAMVTSYNLFTDVRDRVGFSLVDLD